MPDVHALTIKHTKTRNKLNKQEHLIYISHAHAVERPGKSTGRNQIWRTCIKMGLMHACLFLPICTKYAQWFIIADTPGSYWITPWNIGKFNNFFTKKLDVNDFSLVHLILILSLHYLVNCRNRSLIIYNNEFILGNTCLLYTSDAADE